MADLSDVTTYMLGMATTAAYPNGNGQPSVIDMDIRLMEGWPIPAKLEQDLRGLMDNPQGGPPIARPNGQLANVSVFPMLGTNATPYQILNETYTIENVSFGLTVVSVANGTITISGTPLPGEYLTVITDNTYAYSVNASTAAAILSGLATDFSNNYSGVTVTGTTLTIPGTHLMVVRQGGQGTIGTVTHRQRQMVMVTIWAPTPQIRSALSGPIDNYIKANIKVTMPDTSQALIIYNRTNTLDEQMMVTVYRRDLIYEVEYATVLEEPAFLITTVDTSIATYNNPVVAPAIT